MKIIQPELAVVMTASNRKACILKRITKAIYTDGKPGDDIKLQLSGTPGPNMPGECTIFIKESDFKKIQTLLKAANVPVVSADEAYQQTMKALGGTYYGFNRLSIAPKPKMEPPARRDLSPKESPNEKRVRVKNEERIKKQVQPDVDEWISNSKKGTHFFQKTGDIRKRLNTITNVFPFFEAEYDGKSFNLPDNFCDTIVMKMLYNKASKVVHPDRHTPKGKESESDVRKRIMAGLVYPVITGAYDAFVKKYPG